MPAPKKTPTPSQRRVVYTSARFWLPNHIQSVIISERIAGSMMNTSTMAPMIHQTRPHDLRRGGILIGLIGLGTLPSPPKPSELPELLELPELSELPELVCSVRPGR